MIPIKPVTITAPKPQLNSREDYSNLKSFSDSYARGDIKYLDIPYKYRAHIKEDIHTARDKFDKAVQAEKDRYENSNTGKFTNFMGQVVTAPLALPAAEIASPIIGDVSEPVIQAGKKYIVEPAKQYLSTHPTVAKWASAGRTALDLGGIGLGLWHFTSPNGYEKTARKFNEGNLPGALVSAAGDALDLTGFLGLTDLGMRGYRGIKSIWGSAIKPDRFVNPKTNVEFINSISRNDLPMSINRASNYEDQLLLRQQLEQFGEKYGYPVMTGESMSWDDLVAQTKHFMRRHNTFVRDVGDNPQIPLRTREARLRHAATKPRREGDGVWVAPGTLNASGYGGHGGAAYAVRRPVDFSGNPTTWIDKNDWILYTPQQNILATKGVTTPWGSLDVYNPNLVWAKTDEFLVHDPLHIVKKVDRQHYYKKPSMFTKQQYGPVTTHQDGLPVGTKLWSSGLAYAAKSEYDYDLAKKAADLLFKHGIKPPVF